MVIADLKYAERMGADSLTLLGLACFKYRAFVQIISFTATPSRMVTNYADQGGKPKLTAALLLLYQGCSLMPSEGFTRLKFLATSEVGNDTVLPPAYDEMFDSALVTKYREEFIKQAVETEAALADKQKEIASSMKTIDELGG
jgi:hypothetical protein